MARRKYTRTADPTVVIEEQRPGYVRYRRDDGRRWEVHGTCDRRGDCLIGAVVEGETIRDHNDIARLRQKVGSDRLLGELDVPVTPEFSVCCGEDRFTYVVLSEA